MNRDFLFLQGQYMDPRWSASVAQEVDWNSGWKIAAGERRLSPTSTFANLRCQAGRAVALYAGYDDRYQQGIAIGSTLFETAAYQRTNRAFFAKLQYLFRY